MSWLFGVKTPGGQGGVQNPFLPPADAGAGDGSSEGTNSGDSNGNTNQQNAKNTRSDSYTFDSAALERAASAAKELEKSHHAKEALELSKLQEQTAQLDKQKAIKEYEQNIEQIKNDQIRLQQEERRKTLGEETKQHNARAEYQDRLARKRYDEQLAQQTRINEENLKKQEESVAKQEAMRKKTMEYDAELRHKNDMKRIEAEVRAKGKMERENRDVILEQ